MALNNLFERPVQKVFYQIFSGRLSTAVSSVSRDFILLAKNTTLFSNIFERKNNIS